MDEGSGRRRWGFGKGFGRTLLPPLVLPRLDQADQVAIEGVEGGVNGEKVKDRVARLFGFQQDLHLCTLTREKKSSFLNGSKQLDSRWPLREWRKHELRPAGVNLLLLCLRLPVNSN